MKSHQGGNEFDEVGEASDDDRRLRGHTVALAAHVPEWVSAHAYPQVGQASSTAHRSSLQAVTYPSPDPYQRRPVDISAYAPPPRRGGVIWFVVIGVVAVGLIIGALALQPWANRPPEATPTPVPTPSEAPRLPGQPFTMPDDPGSEGRWGITSQERQGESVVLNVWVESDRGDVSYGFVAFSNAEALIHDPAPDAPMPQLEWGDLEPGERVEGHLRFVMPTGPGMLVLTSSLGTQTSALPIDG